MIIYLAGNCRKTKIDLCTKHKANQMFSFLDVTIEEKDSFMDRFSNYRSVIRYSKEED